jgi:hypothetical protein
VTERPRVTGPIYEQPESVKRAAALHVIRREFSHPECMWEILRMLGLEGDARELFAERDGMA